MNIFEIQTELKLIKKRVENDEIKPEEGDSSTISIFNIGNFIFIYLFMFI